MNSDDLDIEEKLNIRVVKRGFQYAADLPGEERISLVGFGESPLEAKYSLLLRILETAPQHMSGVRERMGWVFEELDVRVDIQYFKDGSTLLKVKDSAGRYRLLEGPRTGKRGKRK